MGLWVGTNTTKAGAPPYATDPSYPGQSGWVVEEAGSLPLGKDGGSAFWDFLFKQAADWGMFMYSYCNMLYCIALHSHCAWHSARALDSYCARHCAWHCTHGVLVRR